MKKSGWILAVVLLLFAAAPGFTMTVDDLIELRNAGLDDDVIFTRLQQEGLDAELSVDDMIALKQAGFSSASIKELILMETGAPVADVSDPKAPEEALRDEDNLPVVQVDVDPEEQVETNLDPANQISLLILNRHSDKLSVRVNEVHQTITIADEIEGFGKTLHNNHGIGFTVPAGSYLLRFSGEDASFQIELTADDAELKLITGSDNNVRTLDFVLSQGGTKTDAGRLHRIPVVVRRPVQVQAPVVIQAPVQRTVYVQEPVVIQTRHYCSGCGVYYYGSHTHSSHYYDHYYPSHNYYSRHYYYPSHHYSGHHDDYYGGHYSYGSSHHYRHSGLSLHYGHH